MNEKSRIFDKQTDNQSNRQSNFELLRIVAMVMIIAHHFAVHGGLEYHNGFSPNAIWLQFLHMGGKIGVNLFVLISGYFLIRAKELHISKVIRLVLQVFTYSVLFYCVIVLYRIIVLKDFVFSFQELIENVFPIIHNRWWFASTYMVLLLLSPFISKLLLCLTQSSYFKLLIIMFLMWVLLSTAFHVDIQMNNLLWFVFLFGLAGYIRLYGKRMIINPKKWFWITGAIYFAIFGISVILNSLGNRISFFDSYSDRFFNMNSLLIFGISVLIFVLFRSINIPSNRFINTVASATFGVYLIHDNDYIRQLLTNHMFGRFSLDSSLLIPYSIVVIISIFVVCTGIELLRKGIFERLFVKAIDKASTMIKDLERKVYSGFFG